MTNKHRLQFGIAGTVVTAICCFIPALVVPLAAVGLSAWLVWLDVLGFTISYPGCCAVE